jgi:hypothetical protein
MVSMPAAARSDTAFAAHRRTVPAQRRQSSTRITDRDRALCGLSVRPVAADRLGGLPLPDVIGELVLHEGGVTDQGR